jgi:hypothetical protein
MYNPTPPSTTKTNKNDPVKKPIHYNWHPTGVECIEFIAAFTLPLLADAVKYLWRYRFKGKPIEDLEKAKVYMITQITRDSMDKVGKL